MNDKIKIVFVSHDASLSGAPVLLLNFLKWLHKNNETEFRILLVRGGSIEEDFKALAKTYIWEGHHQSRNIIDKIAGKIEPSVKAGRFKERIINELKSFQPDVVYCNTIVSSPVAYELKKHLTAPFILHMHEMKFSTMHFYRECTAKKYTDCFKRFIAVNPQIREFLIKDIYIDENKIDVIYPFFISAAKPVKTKDDFFTVGFSGAGGWQKGIDLLTSLIATIKYNYDISKFRFVWVGNVENEVIEKMAYELGMINCSNVLAFTGKVTNSREIYSGFDVMCLLSKEDSFPTACLEAAAAGVPVLCFEKAGGMADFIQDNISGFVIPFLNIQEFAGKLDYLQKNPELRTGMGEQASISAQLYSIENIALQLLGVLKNSVNE